MLSTQRRLRAERARARLHALTPGWVPTPEVVDAELRRIDALGSPAASSPPSSPPPGPGDGPITGSETARPFGWAPDRRRLPSLVLLLAGGVLGSVLVWFLAVPRGTPVPPVSVSAAPADTTALSALPSTGSSSGVVAPQPATGDAASGAATVVIDVQGQVHHPGVVELPDGSRVVDALTAAGGVTRRATTLTLNLAQVLVDGTQVLVPSRRRMTAGAASGVSSAQAAEPGSLTGGVVNLNTATLEQLDDLPGIGPVLAQRILDYRSEHGSFTATDQLMDVSGIGTSTFADLESLVGV